MAKELFSLVSPLYQTEAFLRTFVDSVVSQDYTLWELFVVADGPSPEAREIIDSYHDPRIRYVEKPHSGVCDTRNHGKALATGTYIAFPSTDFKLHPGCLRQWLLAFQDHPDADFVYGGYRLMRDGKDMFDWPSEPFDPDQLTVRNYIDGGFPIKRALCPEWDVQCHSLNDWDFWLQAVRVKGLRGHYMANEGRPMITYAAEVPRPKGLSDDSHTNWLERVAYIKRKHGIPQRDVNAWSFGAPFHGKRTARTMGADFSMPSDKPHLYKVLYLLGWYGEHYKQNTLYFKHPTKSEPADAKKIVHWVGSDVTFLSQRTMRELKEIKGLFAHLGLVHLTECQWMHDELAEYGIESTIVPLPLEDTITMTPLPEPFTVGVYMPPADAQKYHAELMHALMRALQDIPFIFFGTPDVGQMGTETHLGHVPIQEAINRCTINLRMTAHDGLPITPIEFLMGGREVITSVPVAHAHHITGTDYATVREALVAKIREIQRSPRSQEDRLAARAFWREETDPDRFLERFYQAAGWWPEGQAPRLALVPEVAHV